MSSFDETFPLQYYINLGRREDRRREAMNGFLDAGLENVRRWAAVDARRVRDARGNENAGRYALALTDRMILREAMLKKAEAVMIFEDDVVLHPQFQQRWAALELPEDWGVLYLGCQHVQMPQVCGTGVPPVSLETSESVKTSGGKITLNSEGLGEREAGLADGRDAHATSLVRVTRALDTQAFAVRRKYYPLVISALKGCTKGTPWKVPPSDQLLARLADTVPMYAAYPNLAWQRVSESDLVGKNYSSYHPSGEQRASWHVMEGFSAVYHGGKVWSGMDSISAAEKFANVGTKVDGGTKGSWGGSPQLEEGMKERAAPSPLAKVAFLFLTIGDLNQAQVWSEYFAGNEAMISRYAHVKFPQRVQTPWLTEAIISEQVETEWGKISLVQATLALLRAALADQNNEWFVLASDSCAPIRPFCQMRRELGFDGRSRIFWESHAEVAAHHQDKAKRIQGLRSITPMYVRFHPQWWLLNREAATAAVEDDFTAHFANVPAPDEMYFGTVLRMKGYPLDERVLKRDITKVSWTGANSPHPVTFSKLTRSQVADFASSECYFARKFSPGCNLAEWGLHL